MAALFAGFSFGASSSIQDETDSMNVSPFTAPPRLPTPPPCSIGELSKRFNQHNLRVDMDAACRRPAYYPNEPLTPPNEPFTPPPNDYFSLFTDFHNSPRRTSYSTLSPAELRLQRQANTRMQCSQSHIKDISDLVRRMIEDNDQCRICEPKPQTSPLAADEDEGVDMDYAPPTCEEPSLRTLKFRRSGDRIVGHAAVSKNIRMRKKSRLSKRPSN